MGEVTGEIRGPLALRCCCRIIIIEDVAGGLAPDSECQRTTKENFKVFICPKRICLGEKLPWLLIAICVEETPTSYNIRVFKERNSETILTIFWSVVSWECL